MKKLKIVFFIGVIIAIIVIPVSIFATNATKTKVDEILAINTVVMGSDSVEVFKEKSREERTKEKIEMSKQYQGNENTTSLKATTPSNDTNSNINSAKSKEVITLEKELENIANKYNRQQDFKSITSIIAKQEINGNFTVAHKNLCELFLDIYEKESLTEEEKSIMKEFFEMVKFNNIDLQLEGRINTIMK